MTSPERTDAAGPIGRTPGIVLAALVVAVCLFAAHRWMDANGFFARPPIHDSSWYRLDALRLREAFVDGGWSGWVKASWNLPGVHPPLLPAITGLFAALSGRESLEPRDLWIVTAFFAAVMLFGVYRLAGNFVPSAHAALAALAAGFCPGIACFFRPFDPQMPMAAMLVWSLDFLVRSRALTRPFPAALSGLAMAAALQAKMLAPLYGIGPVVVALIAARRGDGKAWPRKGLVLFLATSATGLLFWYPAHFWSVIAYTNSVTGGAGQEIYSGAMGRWSAERWLYYPRVLWNQGFTAWTAIFVVAAVGGGLVRAVGRSGRTETARKSWIVAGSILFAFVPLTIGQAGSYALYAIPFVAHGCVAVVAWIRGFDSPNVQRVLRTAFLAAVIATAAVTFRPIDSDRPWADFSGFTINGRTETRLGDAARAVGIVATKSAEDWPIDAFVDEMAGRRADQAIAYGFFAYADHPFMSASNIDYRAEVRHKRVFAQRLAVAMAPRALDDFLAVRDVDYFLIHELTTREIAPRPMTADIKAFLAARGIRTTLVASRKPTAISFLDLIRVDWPRPGTFEWIDAATFDRATIAVTTTPDSSTTPQFVGSRHAVFENDRVALTTYWRVSDADLAEPRHVKVVVASAEGGSVQAPKPLEFTVARVPDGPSERILAVSTDEFGLLARRLTAVDVELTFGSSVLRSRLMIGRD